MYHSMVHRMYIECTILWKMIWRFLKKLGIRKPYDPAIPLLSRYPEKTIIENDTCIPMFIAALFTIARTWKQTRCPSTDGWIKKLWYIYTLEYLIAIKRNAFEPILMRWMNLESIIQCEVSLTEKNKQPNQKVGKRAKQTFLQKRHTDG